MKRFLLSLMVVVMLTPGLVCSPFLCLKPAQAATSMEKMPCCPKAQRTDKNSLMLKNCYKVDLFQSTNHFVLKKPDFSKTFTVVLNQPETSILMLTDYKFTRGPPPDWPAVSQTQPSIILTTLRIRE